VPTVGCHIEVVQEVVSESLADVRSVKLESHEHDAGPDHDAEVHLANQAVLLLPCPSCQGIEAMCVFPIGCGVNDPALPGRRHPVTYQSGRG